ncbi:MAG: hypothetical protein A2136_09980 [Chloroflexi bacterium RBG_16_54_11]|nr:MAG: hypothetical protein A2136_09980 [Chloroflexi bacterium RBG_16_54_11]
MKNLIFILMLIALLIASCRAQTDEPLAQQVLVEFLKDLHNGRYEDAAKLYGGTYETMIDHNPNLDPTDHIGLMKNACTINGSQCLEVKSVTIYEISATEIRYNVEFLNADGTLFVQGPCCGGNETDFPPVSNFILTVIKDDESKFLVMNMPPYAP